MGRPRKYPLPLNAEDGQKYTATASHNGDVVTIEGNDYYREPKPYEETDIKGYDEFGDAIRVNYPQQHEIFKSLRHAMQSAINKYKDALFLYEEIGRFIPDGEIGEDGVKSYTKDCRVSVPQKLDAIVHDTERKYHGSEITHAVAIFEGLIKIDRNLVY